MQNFLTLGGILISRVRINSGDEKFAFKLNTSSSLARPRRTYILRPKVT